MLLIGSRALKIWQPDLDVKENADWDVIISPHDYLVLFGQEVDIKERSWKHGQDEFHNSVFLNNADCCRYASGVTLIKGPEELRIPVCSPRGLAVIKRSHLHRSISFSKHIRHYQLMDRNFSEKDLDFIKHATNFIEKKTCKSC